ncbi:MAG: hypothetical protein EXR75_12035, partial [Myxococcales bacterium]|nr:hypothetical protein [Myxococcales bacterium]
MATKLLIPLAFALAIVTAPSLALAEHGTVASLVRGPAFNPGAPTLTIAPPRGGYVMLSRDGALLGWYLQPAVASLEAGATYTLVAVRGTAMLGTVGIVAQPGVTEIAWRGMSDQPALAYHPPVYYAPAYGYGSQGGYGSQYGDAAPYGNAYAHAAGPVAPNRVAVIADHDFDNLIEGLESRATDRARFGLLRRHARRFWFEPAQAERLLIEFGSAHYRRAAARLLS